MLFKTRIDSSKNDCERPLCKDYVNHVDEETFIYNFKRVFNLSVPLVGAITLFPKPELSTESINLGNTLHSSPKRNLGGKKVNFNVYLSR